MEVENNFEYKRSSTDRGGGGWIATKWYRHWLPDPGVPISKPSSRQFSKFQFTNIFRSIFKVLSFKVFFFYVQASSP